MSVWFTNRGQMIQVVCAVIAAVVALMVWLAVPPQKLLYAAPIAFITAFTWITWLVASKINDWYFAAQAYERLKASTPASSPTPAPISVARRPVALHVAHIRCKVGDFWEGAFGEVGNFRVIVHSIAKMKGQNEYRADVEVAKGVGHLVGGSETTAISAARYWIPRSSDAHYAEPKSVHLLEIIEPYQVHLFSLRVEHINPNEKEVTLEICHMLGKPEILKHPLDH